jgi:hypothetical protein
MCFFFFGFHTGFRPTKGGRLIRLMRRGMHTGQALFPLGIEPGIPRVHPWKELLATGAQSTWFNNRCFVPVKLERKNTERNKNSFSCEVSPR